MKKVTEAELEVGKVYCDIDEPFIIKPRYVKYVGKNEKYVMFKNHGSDGYVENDDGLVLFLIGHSGDWYYDESTQGTNQNKGGEL